MFKKVMIIDVITFIAIVCYISLITGCASQPVFSPRDPVPDDRNPISKPSSAPDISDYYDAFDKQIILQGEQSFDLSRQARTIMGKPNQALNVDAFDEIADSSWFTNRNAFERMSSKDIIRGPNTGDGPDAGSSWTIIRAKNDGITPGFHICDGNGNRFVIKLDPPGYCGLNSGAEVVSTKLFYAAGYNTPENYLVDFHPDILKLSDPINIVDKHGWKRQMTEADLSEIINNADKLPNGCIRAMASKYISGKLLGPFEFDGTREDDPNDFIPHESRRELRGQKILSIWLNHIDPKAINTLDTYVGEDGKGHVIHYIIDFGASLGSGGKGPQPKFRGHENEFDPLSILLNIGTLGVYVKEWEKTGEVLYPSIGYLSPEHFHPEDFKFMYPNPAYDNCTDLDAYWGAKIVVSFTDEQIKAAVSMGQYGPEASEYLSKTLISRRDIIGRYWFTKVTPLDKFMIEGNALHFSDLSVDMGYERKEETTYFYEISDNTQKIASGKLNDTILSLSEISGYNDNSPIEISIRVKRSNNQELSEQIRIYLGLDKQTKQVKILGLIR